MTYGEALKDWKYLWKFGPAYDMSGGYVDQDDLYKLLMNPTKATATKCLCRQISYWFDVGPDVDSSLRGSLAERDRLLRSNKRLQQIAEKY